MKTIFNAMRAIHPGEILRQEFVEPLNVDVKSLAKDLNMPAKKLYEIMLERKSLDVDTAMRLAAYFGGGAKSWLNLQYAYDIKMANLQQSKSLGIKPCRA